MSAEVYAALPETLVVRELRYTLDRPGFRTRSVTLVTTLLDAETYSAEALAKLYGARGGGDEPASLEADDEDGCVAVQE